MLHIVTNHKYTIAIAGTHGKTTTTAMIGYTLREMGKDPSMIVGSLIQNNFDTQIIENPPALPSLRGLRHDSDFQQSASQNSNKSRTNYWAGKSDLFVVEACEYRRSFLNIKPNILVITNIDADHLDYYKDIADIQSAFHELAVSVPESGYIVCNPNDDKVASVLVGTTAQIIDYTKFFDNDMKLQIPGLHNKYNASGALAVIEALHLDKNEASKKLAQFPGTWRRFEYKGTMQSGTKVYDDYAHHPTEVKACLQGFRELYPASDGYKVTVVFQPHLFSRTKALLDEFTHSFAEADNVLILPIYYAREEDDGTVSAHTLADAIGSGATGYDTFEQAEDYLNKMNLGDKDILVTMGAGEAFKVGDTLLFK
jgi:UDP-N-acetylmuramate--alanine ligase